MDDRYIYIYQGESSFWDEEYKLIRLSFNMDKILQKLYDEEHLPSITSREELDFKTKDLICVNFCISTELIEDKIKREERERIEKNKFNRFDILDID